ncbi:MAG: 4-hydroxy-tetrahydrodipicolinate reductase, partial [bacterium]|nr:4-hydroxy-tetrahydrodipicolinate reductase [bacterium]
EVLHIRHDASGRECFMSGVVLAVQKVRSLTGLVTGLENVLDVEE